MKIVSYTDNQILLSFLRKTPRILIAFLFTVGVITSFTAQAEATKTGDFKKYSIIKIVKNDSIDNESRTHLSEKSSADILWNMGITGDQFENQFEKHTLSHFYLQSSINYRVLSYLGFNLSPRFSYTTGYTLNRDQMGSTSSQLSVQNAAVILTPNQSLNAEIGALNQSSYLHSILICDSTFPALRLTLKNENIGLTTESAIASASSTSNQTENTEKTPTFNTIGLFAQLNNSRVNLKMNISYFEFANLPLSVATASVQNGNSGQNTSGIDSEFIYEYKGYLASGEIKTSLTSNFALGSQFALILNNQAPEKTNLGYQGQLFSDIDVNKDLSFTPSIEYFEIQSDATVANYNGAFFNTNRAGYRIGLAMTIQNKLKVTLTAGERIVLVENPTQENEKMINLKLETMYVPLF